MNEEQHNKAYEYADRVEAFAEGIETLTEGVLSAVELAVGHVATTLKTGAEKARDIADQAVVAAVDKEDKITAEQEKAWNNSTAIPKDVREELLKIIKDLYKGKM